MLVAFLNFVPCCASVFLVAPPHRVSHLLLWPPTRICLMLMKVSVAQIKPKAWKSVKQIAICFLSHAAWQEKEMEGGMERDTPSSQDLIDCLLWACTRIFYTACTAVYILYTRTTVYSMLSVPRCVVHAIDLLITDPFAGCLLTAAFGSDCFGLVWFGSVLVLARFGLVYISIRFQFSKCHKAGLLQLVSWLCNQCSFYHKLIIF